jgi:hypothetical protein
MNKYRNARGQLAVAGTVTTEGMVMATLRGSMTYLSRLSRVRTESRVRSEPTSLLA